MKTLEALINLHLLEGFHLGAGLEMQISSLNWLPNFFSITGQSAHVPAALTQAEKSLHIDVVTTRTFKSSNLLPYQYIKLVQDEFMSVVPRIFGKILVFGFMFGGFAKGYAVSNQYADFFICVYEEKSEEIESLRKWYFDLHERYDLAPDIEAPCSLTTLTHLREKMDFAHGIRLNSTIVWNYEKQAIVWADILTGAKIGKIGNLHLLCNLEESCCVLPQKWRKELVDLLVGPIDPEVAKLPLSRLFRHVVTYEKKENRLTKPKL